MPKTEKALQLMQLVNLDWIIQENAVLIELAKMARATAKLDASEEISDLVKYENLLQNQALFRLKRDHLRICLVGNQADAAELKSSLND